MEKGRRIKVLSLCALIVAVLGLTIAFAALSQTLTIKGSADVSATSWNVHFDKNVETRIQNNAKFITEPSIADNELKADFKVELTKPGDGVYLGFKIVNDGSVMAKLSDHIILNGTDIYDMGLAEDTEIARILFEEADWDGDGVTTDEERLKAKEIITLNYDFEGGVANSYDYTLIQKNGGTISMPIYIFYKGDATELPKGNLVLNTNFELLFEQY